MGRWRLFHYQVFVTAYRGKEVWCCMSSGDTGRSVVDNVITSSLLCQEDPRRLSLPPTRVEITLLAPKAYWRPISVNELNPEKHMAIAGRGDKLAFFLPSVWEEYPYWTAKELVAHLEIKAGGKLTALYEVPNIVLKRGLEIHHGM